ncbi:hypothetical protein [Bradyrhizobium sp. USDA 10063]
MVGCAMNSLTRAKGRPKHKVLLLLDEAAALGSLEPLERGRRLLARLLHADADFSGHAPAQVALSPMGLVPCQ